jgi:hypothetical protein
LNTGNVKNERRHKLVVVLQATALLAIVLTARFSCIAHVQIGEKQQSGSTVYGRAIYHDSQRPARRVLVVLRSLTSFGPEQLSAITNARGEFRIKNVPGGRYFIGVNGRGLVSTDSFIIPDESRAMRFDLPRLREYFEEVELDGRTDKQVVVRVHHGGIITGKVSYADGEPAVQHPVTVLRRNRNRYSMFLDNANGTQETMLTDDRGIFRVAGLATGEYIVGATPMIEHGELVKDEILEANMIGSSLAMTFYPSTPLPTQAKPIRIEAAEEKSGIDITIPDQEMHIIAGVVRMRGDQKPVADARVGIIRKETFETVGRAFWPYSEGMPGVNTDEVGRFRLREVPDGRYLIFVESRSNYGELPPGAKRYSAKQQEVEVSGGDINNLSIEVGDDATVSGTLIVEGGPTPRAIDLTLMRDLNEAGVSSSASVSPGGKFVIRSVPSGQTYFSINLGEEISRFYIKSITWNGKDLLREPLNIDAGQKIDNVRIVLSTQVAGFTFRLRNTRGEAISDVPLTLVPADPARWERREAQLMCMTDPQGKCTVIGAPVEYLVFILPRGLQQSTLLNDEIAERATTAQRVSLGPGERRTFDIATPRDK